jgi:hypothetical protein
MHILFHIIFTVNTPLGVVNTQRLSDIIM